MFMPAVSGASKVRWQCIVCLPHCIMGCSVSPLVLQHFHHRRISCIVSGVGVAGHMRGAKKQVSQLIASPLRQTSHRIARITFCSVQPVSPGQISWHGIISCIASEVGRSAGCIMTQHRSKMRKYRSAWYRRSGIPGVGSHSAYFRA
jgi:hypothetical protein